MASCAVPVQTILVSLETQVHPEHCPMPEVPYYPQKLDDGRHRTDHGQQYSPKRLASWSGHWCHPRWWLSGSKGQSTGWFPHPGWKGSLEGRPLSFWMPHQKHYSGAGSRQCAIDFSTARARQIWLMSYLSLVCVLQSFWCSSSLCAICSQQVGCHGFYPWLTTVCTWWGPNPFHGDWPQVWFRQDSARDVSHILLSWLLSHWPCLFFSDATMVFINFTFIYIWFSSQLL